MWVSVSNHTLYFFAITVLRMESIWWLHPGRQGKNATLSFVFIFPRLFSSSSSFMLFFTCLIPHFTTDFHFNYVLFYFLTHFGLHSPCNMFNRRPGDRCNTMRCRSVDSSCDWLITRPVGQCHFHPEAGPFLRLSNSELAPKTSFLHQRPLVGRCLF